MSRRDLRNCRVIVTGASSGIGEALVRCLAERGAWVLMTARRAERLHGLTQDLEARGQRVASVVGDVVDPQTRQQCLDEVQRRWGGLDILINNAGIGAVGPFAEATADRLRRIMEVDFFAPVEFIRAALPLLAQGNQPAIVNIGSVLGHRAVPGKSEYSAAKFALHGFSDALRAELAPQGIDVLLISPSTTRSEFFASVVEGDATGDARRRGMAAHVVARATVRAIQRRRHEVVLSAGGKLLVWADRLCPTLMDRLLARHYRTMRD